MRRGCVELAAGFCLALSLGLATDLKVLPIGACDKPGLSDAVRAALAPEGLRVAEAAGVLCEVWYSRAIPVDAPGASAGYGAIPPGSLAGVIAYSGKAEDYRGQGLRPGIYTMRYAHLPADGNHMGVSPTTDYFLLSPIELDRDPGARIEYEKLLDLSRKASGTNHPSVLYLVEPAGGPPRVRDLEGGRYALESAAKAVSASGGAEFPFPIALVLLGHGGE